MHDKLVPDMEVLIEGQKLDQNIMDKIISVKIDYNLEKIDMFIISFNDSSFKIQNSKLFEVGKNIIIKLGYSRKFTKMIEGEVVQMDFTYETSSPIVFSIIGFDKMFRLSRTKHSRSFLKMKDSEIASKIASEMGLQTQIDSTSQRFEYLFQNNQSNLNFLKQRARRINYEIEVEDNTLVFQKARHEKRKKTVTLRWENNLISFRPKIDATKIVDEVQVKGWNYKTKELIKGVARTGDEVQSIRGKLGSSSVKGKFKNTSFKNYQTNIPIASQEEADNFANSKLNKLNMGYLTGYGIAIGEVKIRAGHLIEIEGVGKMLEGEYYITACEHSFSTRGYKVFFDVQRNIEK